MAETIKADYLIIGAGASGMAFADSLLAHSTDKTIVIIDRQARPGGHWQLAYPFVRLHQPAAWYGVNSRVLGTNVVEELGGNKGLSDLSSRDEINAYYDRHMQQTLLSSERVKWYPNCEYLGAGTFRSLLTGKEHCVDITQTKLVETSYVKVTVPSMRPPPYAVAQGVDVVTPNELPNTKTQHAHYTIAGAGKTGIDTCLWLLNNGIPAESITWIIPRDPIFLDRSSMQPGAQFAERFRERIRNQNKAIMQAENMDDCVERLQACGQFLKFDESIKAKTFHAAIVSPAELQQMRQVKNVVRKGRILSVSPDRVELTEGSYVPEANTLYIDCTASALSDVPPVPVFQNNQIVLQTVRFCQPVFSAALIGFVEAIHASNEQTQNELCRPVRYPDIPKDYLILQLQTHLNTIRWAQDERLVEWLADSRLNWFTKASTGLPLQQMAKALAPLCEKLEKLVRKQPEEDRRRSEKMMDLFEAAGQPRLMEKL